MWKKPVLVLTMLAFILATFVPPIYAKDKLKCTVSVATLALAWGGLFVAAATTGGAAIAVAGFWLGSFTGWMGVGESCF